VKNGISFPMSLTITDIPDGYDICKYCVIDIAKEMDDRPAEVIKTEIREPVAPVTRIRRPTRTTGMAKKLLGILKEYPRFMTAEIINSLLKQKYQTYTGDKSCVLTALARLFLEGLIEKRDLAGSKIKKEYRIKLKNPNDANPSY
jgi:hypothetical protein